MHMGGVFAENMLHISNGRAGCMMPRWFWFVPVALLTLAGALYAFRLGWIAATITETDVINTYAREYLRTAGPEARATDCVARPAAQRGVWLVVSCGEAPRYDYAVDRFGRLIAPAAFNATAPAT
jgi:hypothetical protein